VRLTDEKEWAEVASPVDDGSVAEVGYVEMSVVHCKMKKWLREGDTAFGLAAEVADTVGFAHMKAVAASRPLQSPIQRGHNLQVAMLLLIYLETEKCVGKSSGEGGTEMMMLAAPTPALRKEVGRKQGLNRWEGEKDCWT